MNQTLVGVFNSYQEAERACAELEREGFDRSAMHVKSTDSDDSTSSVSSTGTTTHEGTGVMASIRHFFAELFGDEEEHVGNYSEAVRRGHAVLTVEADEDRIDTARDVLTRCDAIDVDEQAVGWRSQGWTGYDETAEPVSREQAGISREQAGNERENVVPVVQEELEVGKRQVRGGAVRVVSRVVSKPVSESVELRREEATIERHPVDRPATEADLAALKDRTIEVQEMAEKAVVNKTAHVVEEVVVGKQVSNETQRVEDSVRRTEVDVERVGEDERAGSSDQVGERTIGATRVTSGSTVGGQTSGEMAQSGSTGGDSTSNIGGARTSGGNLSGTPVGGGVAGTTSGVATHRRDFADVDDEFRRDYLTNYSSAGGSYEDYQPAYRGGYESRYDSRFANRSWDEAEPELRQRWESEHPGSAWERVKAAVRRGWDKATA
jgi:uncharacterized protein (TIGR02271 family)